MICRTRWLRILRLGCTNWIMLLVLAAIPKIVPVAAAAPRLVPEPAAADAAPEPIPAASSDNDSASDGEREATSGDTDLLASVPKIVDLRPSSFKDITPGETNEATVRELLGDPAEEARRDGDSVQLVYRTGPFSKIDVLISGEVVESIVLHLKRPTERDDIASELSLTTFTPAPVSNAKGDVLGWTYPERGILLNLERDVAKPRVSQIVLEAISAEPFLHRVQVGDASRVGDHLADLAIVLQLDPRRDEAHWRRAQLLAAVGDFSGAMQEAERAVRQNDERIEYKMTLAQLLAERGEFERARQLMEKVLADQTNPALEAQAEFVIGEILSSGPTPNMKKALEHHLKSVKIATTLDKDVQTASRATAETLLYGYLAAACDISAGNFANKIDAAQKWLLQAEKLLPKVMELDSSDPLPVFRSWQKSLDVRAELEVLKGLDELVQEIFEDGREHIAAGEDRVYQQILEWELASALAKAVDIEQSRGNSDAVLTYANNALALAEPLVAIERSSPTRLHTVGKLHFHIGSVYAVGRQDHREAARHYDKAIRFLNSPLPPKQATRLGAHGERFVSMGVTFWQAGQRDRAMEITKQGVSMMDEAVQKGWLERQALAVPYNNLAEMYRAQGNHDEAHTLAAMAAKLIKDSRPSGAR